MVTSRHQAGLPPFFGRLVSLSVKYPTAVTFAWLVCIAVLGNYATKLPQVVQGHGLTPSGDAAYLQRQLSLEYGLPPNPVLLVLEADAAGSLQGFRAYISDALNALQATKEITVAASPLDGSGSGMLTSRVAYAVLAANGNPAALEAGLAERLRERLPRSEHYRAALTGKPVVQEAVNEASRGDLAQAERYGIPLACLILWLAFGGLLPALIPVAMAIVAVTSTMGMLYFVGKQTPLTVFVLDVVPMAGLALCLDFSLLLVNRFREETGVLPVVPAVYRTMAASGRAVAYSGACVVAGLAGTLFIPMPMFKTLACGAIAVTLVALLANFTLLPAILAVAGHRLRGKPKPKPKAGMKSAPRQERPVMLRRPAGWERLPRFAMKRPVRTSLLCGGLLIACLLPLGGLRVAVPDADSLPRGDAARLAFHAYRQAFSSDTGSEVELLARPESGQWGLKETRELDGLLARLKEDREVLGAILVPLPVSGIPAEGASGNAGSAPARNAAAASNAPPGNAPAGSARAGIDSTGRAPARIGGESRLIRVLLRDDSASAEARSWVRAWDGGARQGSLVLRAGGEAKYEQEVYDAVAGRLPQALLFALAVNYALLFLAFRSYLIPLKSLLMNMLGICAAFGVLAGAAELGLFGMEGGRVAIMIPVFIFGLVFGISMDYGVFLLSRIAEAYERTGDNAQAIAEGAGRSGKIITAAAAIMIAVSLPFAWGRIEGVKQLGIGIAAAIFLDATIIRMLLVPALMAMLGDWNWRGPGGWGRKRE